MAPRPKNPPPDRRAEILEAALRVFSRRGYTAATNAEIAREAGVTAAALYYYFPSKEDLFKAAISERQASFLPTIQQMAGQMRQMPPQMVIPFLIKNLVRFMTEERTQAILRIVLAEGPRNPELSQIWQSRAVGPLIPVLLGYLEHQIDQGALRRMDPRVMAMMLNGPVMATVIMRDFLQVPLVEGLTNDALAAQLAEAVLNGVLLEEEPEGKKE